MLQLNLKCELIYSSSEFKIYDDTLETNLHTYLRILSRLCQ